LRERCGRRPRCYRLSSTLRRRNIGSRRVFRERFPPFGHPRASWRWVNTLFKWLSCITLAFGHRINDLLLKTNLAISSTRNIPKTGLRAASLTPETSQTLLYSLFTVAINDPGGFRLHRLRVSLVFRKSPISCTCCWKRGARCIAKHRSTNVLVMEDGIAPAWHNLRTHSPAAS
jgi:hypothetical protein